MTFMREEGNKGERENGCGVDEIPGEIEMRSTSTGLTALFLLEYVLGETWQCLFTAIISLLL